MHKFRMLDIKYPINSFEKKAVHRIELLEHLSNMYGDGIIDEFWDYILSGESFVFFVGDRHEVEIQFTWEEN